MLERKKKVLILRQQQFKIAYLTKISKKYFQFYKGDWKNNKAHGKGKFWHVDGDIFEGKREKRMVNTILISF